MLLVNRATGGKEHVTGKVAGQSRGKGKRGGRWGGGGDVRGRLSRYVLIIGGYFRNGEICMKWK